MTAEKLVINHLNKNFNVDGESVNILNEDGNVLCVLSCGTC